jgi:futalosine hydrolase
VKILVTAATKLEITPLKKLMAKSSLKKKPDFLVTGIGMTATAYHLAKNNTEKYDLLVNIGLAGSFKKKISIGELVNVVSDCFADLGAEDGSNFLTLAEMKLKKKNEFPYRNERLINLTAKKYPVLKRLKRVNAITINTVHGNEKTIKDVVRKFNPDIESMEGAAFFYVCMMEKIPCVQLRAISNYVERRNKDNWNIPLALKNLTEVTFDFLKAVQI